MNARKAARALGWFSIGLGAIEVVAPGWLQRQLGVKGHSGLTRFYGMRELLAGAGILGRANPAPWVWSRVAGDALDLLTLGMGAAGSRRKGRMGLAIASVAAVTALDALVARRLSRGADTTANLESDAEAGTGAAAASDSPPPTDTATGAEAAAPGRQRSRRSVPPPA